jgi:hypothetical protein
VTPYVVLAAVVSRVGADPINREDARRRAHAELSHAIYHRYDDSLPVRVMKAIQRFLDHLFSTASSNSPGGGVGAVAFVVLLVAVVVIARWRLGPMARTAHVSVDILADTIMTAAEHRRRADAAAAAGDWKTALIERMRALARGLEQRALLDPRPGRTADELAAEAGRLLPTVRDLLTSAATTFDAVAYGDRTATAGDYETVRRADDAVAAARPVELAAV